MGKFIQEALRLLKQFSLNSFANSLPHTALCDGRGALGRSGQLEPRMACVYSCVCICAVRLVHLSYCKACYMAYTHKRLRTDNYDVGGFEWPSPLSDDRRL